MELFLCTCRVPGGTRPRRAARDPSATGARSFHALCCASCLGNDVILLGRASRCVHTLYAGYSALQSPATPRLGVPLWGGCWCDVPQLRRFDAVVSGLSCARTDADRRGVDSGAADDTPIQREYCLGFCDDTPSVPPRGALHPRMR